MEVGMDMGHVVVEVNEVVKVDEMVLKVVVVEVVKVVVEMVVIKLVVKVVMIAIVFVSPTPRVAGAEKETVDVRKS